MTGLKLSLLGPPRVELNGTPVDIQRRKALALLVYLAVTGQAHSRDALATFFWPDLDQQRARAYLRRDLAALNTSLPGNWLIADRETVELNREAGPWLDTEQFQRLLTASQKHSHAPEIVCPDCILLLTEAVALYTGDFLAGFTLRDSPEFDDWQFFQTESLHQELATALERLVRGLKTQGQAERAVPYARRWVALDPLYEPAQRQLIQVYDQAGQPAAALRQYEEYVRLLEEELGLPPEEETTTLYEAIKAKRIFAPFIKAEEHKRSSQRRRSEQLAPESPAAPGGSESPFVSPGLSSSKAPGSAPMTPTRPVGREAELGQLAARLEQALAGSRQLVFITGEAGLGKTTLVETFLEEARHKATFWIGQGQCIEHRGAGEAYMPVLEALGRMCREADGQALIALLTRTAPTWLVQMPWLVGPEDFETLQGRVLGTTRERMLRELVEAVEMLTAERPLILVLEDLQWSDYSTLDLLTRLAVRQEPARLLLIGTYRPADVKMQDHPLRAVVQDIQLRGQGMELSLPLLTATMVESYLGLRFSEANFLAELAHLLHQRTDGNPLFIRTLSDTWVAQGLLAEVEGHWMLQAKLEDLMAGVPDTLRLLIEQQFRQLNSVEQTILEVASVTGMEFSIATLMTGVDLTEEELERRCVALAQLGPFCEASGIVEWPDGTVTAQFKFSHSLYQEVMYQRVPAGRKVYLHRQIGRRLEIGYGAKAAAHAAELGLHFVQGRDPGRAITYLQYAAEQAAQRNAYREAIEHLTQALEFLQRYPDLPEHSAYELGLQAALGPALILTRGWATPEAEQAFVRAKELSQRLEDIGQLSSVLYGLAVLSELRGQYAHSQALMEERLQLPHDPEDYTLQVESYEVLACSTFHQGAFTQAVTHANQALIFGNPPNNSLMTLLGKNTAVASQYWGGLALWFLGYPDQAVVRSQQALKQVQSFSYTFSLAYAREQEAMLYHLQREATVVYQQAEAAITAAIQGGFSYWLGVGQIFRGWALVVRGQAERGMGQLRQGLDICQATGATIDQPYFLSMLADACGRTGRPEEGVAALAEALTLVRQSPAFFYEAELHRLKGELLLQLEPEKNMASAEACFQQALDIARHQQAKSLELRAAMSLSRLWQKQGQGDQARSMLAEVYNWFSEGFDTTDLQEAKTLLEELGGEVKQRSKGVEEILPQPLTSFSQPVSHTGQKLEQEIRFCTAPDGVRIAYAAVGYGPPLVKTANWFCHLEYEWQSPVWRHWLEGMARQHTLIRYDKRGCGLSDRDVTDFALPAQVADLETVVDALGLTRFPLLGLSGGGSVALAYAVRHPEQVSHLILYGSSARGRLKRSQTMEQLEEAQMLLKVMELGWGKANPAFRQVYTGLFIPEGTAEQIRWFNDLQRISTSPEIAVRMAIASFSVDVSDLAPQVTVPTLVLHARDDAVTPLAQSCYLADLIPGARLVILESKNHILLEHEPAWPQFLDEVHQFLGVEPVKLSNQTILATPPLALHPDFTVPTSPHHLPSQTMPFVGREREYTQLVEMLKSLGNGIGHAVLIEGEPGIGKSRLAEEVVRTAQNQGVIVLSSKCYEIEQRMPYQTVIDLVYQALSSCPSGTFQHLPASTMAELAFLVPEIEQIIPNLPALATGLDQARQARLFRALQQFLTAAAGEKALVVVVDDLHWADEVTLQFLPYFARHIANQPVLLIGTFRSEEAAANEQLSAYLRTLLQDPHSLHLVLNRLSLKDTCALVAPAPQAAELGQWLHRETEGNPLFLISILQSLQEEDILKEDDPTWQINLPRLQTATTELTLPEALREAVRNRLRHISKQARTILEVAAVYGRSFDLSILSAVTAESELPLVDMVEELTTRQLLREDEDGLYDFCHDKIREVAYHDLSIMRCRLLHRRFAEALEARGNQAPNTLAEHFEKGQTWDKAITYLAQAAEQARKLFAMPEALRFYDRAIALAEQHPGAVNQRVVLDLHEQRGKVRGLMGGMTDEAVADLALVLEAARAAGELDKERDLLINMGQVYRRVDQYESALYYLEEGLNLARQREDQQSVVDALYHLGTVAWSQGYNDKALTYHQEAVDICRQLGLTNLVAVQALHGLGEARWLSGDAKGGIELYEESLDLARQIQDKSYECENLGNIGYASQGLHGLADYQRAEQILKEDLEISRAAHLEWHFVIALAHLGLNYASKGDFQQALTFINQSIDLTEAIGAKRLQSTYTWARGFLWLELNLLERAKADHTQAIALARQTHAGDWLPRLQADFAISQLRLGHLEVEDELQAALAHALRHRMEIHATRCLEGLTELALAKGEPQQALAYAERLQGLAERHDLREIMARALHWRGMALLAREQFETAAVTLQQALEMAEGYGRIRLVWQLHAALADLYRAQKQEEKAAAHEMQVQQIVRRIAVNLQEAEFRAGLPLTG